MEQTRRERQAPSFHELLDAARQGSSEALGTILESFHGYLKGKNAVPSAGDLRANIGESDWVQEVFMEAVRDFHTFHGNSRKELTAWLARILRNDTATIRASLHTAKRDIGREELLDTSRDWDERIVDRAPSPEAVAMAQEARVLADRLFAQLDERQQEIVRLRFGEKLPYEVIGDRLGITAGAARKAYDRARDRLHELMRVSSAGPVLAVPQSLKRRSSRAPQALDTPPS